MSKYRNEAHEFFSNLSDEEFEELSENVGFELEKGEGKVIFTDDTKELFLDIAVTSKFNMKSNAYKTSKDNRPQIKDDFNLAI